MKQDFISTWIGGRRTTHKGSSCCLKSFETRESDTTEVPVTLILKVWINLTHSMKGVMSALISCGEQRVYYSKEGMRDQIEIKGGSPTPSQEDWVFFFTREDRECRWRGDDEISLMNFQLGFNFFSSKQDSCSFRSKTDTLFDTRNIYCFWQSSLTFIHCHSFFLLKKSSALFSTVYFTTSLKLTFHSLNFFFITVSFDWIPYKKEERWIPMPKKKPGVRI